MGFSALGLALSVAIFVPSLVLIWFPPRPPIGRVEVPRVLEVLERVGQGLCVIVPTITVGASVRWWWFAPVVIAVMAYWALWARFLVSGRSRATLFGAVWGVPVPMALLPVGAFLASAGWLQNPWIAGAAVVLAAGHVPNSLITARSA